LNDMGINVTSHINQFECIAEGAAAKKHFDITQKFQQVLKPKFVTPMCLERDTSQTEEMIFNKEPLPDSKYKKYNSRTLQEEINTFKDLIQKNNQILEFEKAMNTIQSLIGKKEDFIKVIRLVGYKDVRIFEIPFDEISEFEDKNKNAKCSELHSFKEELEKFEEKIKGLIVSTENMIEINYKVISYLLKLVNLFKSAGLNISFGELLNDKTYKLGEKIIRAQNEKYQIDFKNSKRDESRKRIYDI
jgi:hypothetical protein